MTTSLPAWALELISHYESHATNQFLLCGNADDEFPLSSGKLGNLEHFLLAELLPGFDVVLTYDIGNGLRVIKGGPLFSQWRGAEEAVENRRAPRPAIEAITHYLRYVANLGQLGQTCPQTAVIIHSAELVAPALMNSLSYDLNALALLIREWSREEGLRRQPVASFLVTENLSDLHPLLAENPDAKIIQIPLPTAETLERGLVDAGDLGEFSGKQAELAGLLTGATLKAVRRLLRLKSKGENLLTRRDIPALKKSLIENDSGSLIEFIEPTRTLDDFEGQPALKNWLRQDLALWAKNDLKAIPKGYLFCGPVGTGKTYAVECLAGEAGVPVVKLGNFRDRWVGSSEGNLEKIFRLLRALGRCFVFVDEADQTLGKRDAGSNDAGLSGRIYSMFAQEMSDRRNRGRIIWILASSRPDLIEVDLKRPGRVDVKIPLFPTSTARESFNLLKALLVRLELDLPESLFERVAKQMPLRLTPGAAEALASKLYRQVNAAGESLEAALSAALADYRPPVSPEIMEFQIQLAAAEATDAAFVPEAFRLGTVPR